MNNLRSIYALNGASMIALLLSQVLIVPFYLRYMGIAGYERWIFISALGNICLIFDFGLTLYISNSARIAYGQGDRESAEKIIGQGLCLFLLLFIPFTFLPALYYALHHTSENLALAIVLFSTPITIIRFWLYYVLTARTSQIGELVIFICSTIAQTLALIVVVIMGGGIVQLAIVQTITGVLFGILPALFALRHYAPELCLHPRKVHRNEWGHIIRGSLTNFSYSAASVTIVYLPVILLGIIPGLPSGSLATFTTSRTLTGVVRQFCQQLARSNVIEISRYLAPEHGQRMRRMFLLGSATISVLAAIGMGALLPVADLVLKVWTGKPELYNPAVIWIFCIAAVMSAQVQLPMILPQFTNTARMMTVPLLLQVCLLGVLGLLGGYYFGAPGMVAALGFAELSTLGTVSLLRIIPQMGISPLRFLMLSAGPSIVVFIASASTSFAARWLIHPTNLYGLVYCGVLWSLVMLPFSVFLYRMARRYQGS